MAAATESTQQRPRASIERYGVEPIPPELRTVGWHDLFAILFTFNLSPLVYVLGALAVTVGGLPLWWAAGTMGIGGLVATSLLTVPGRAGVDDGLPGQVAMRATFGEWGSRGLTSMYRVISSAYWFGAQALAAAFGLTVLFAALTGREFGLAPVAVVLASFSVLLAAVGFDALRYFVRIVGPLIIVFVAILVALFLTTDEPAFGVSRVFGPTELSFTWVSVAVFFTVAAGGQLSFATNIADFCRYARSRNHMRVGIVAGSTLGFFIAAWVGAYAATAIDSTNPFAAAAELTENRAILIFLFVAIAAQVVSVNVMNLYTGGLSLVNTMPRLGRLASTLVAGAVALAVSGFPAFINEATEWFTRVASLGAALAGVLLADYAIIARYKIDVPALFDPKGRYRFLGGVNPAALVAVALGTGAFFAVPDDWIKVAWGLVVGLLAYLALAVPQAVAFPSIGPRIAALGRAIPAHRARPAPRGPEWAASVLAAEIGQALQEARVHQGLDVGEVETALGISATYLSALEEATFDRMPSHAYARGFLQAYAEHLGLDAQELLYEFDSLSAWRPAPRSRRRGRWLAVTGAVLLLAGAGAGVAVWQLASNSGASSDTSAPRPSEPLAQAGTPMPAEGSRPTQAATEVDPTSEAPTRDAVQQAATARLVLAAARGDSWLSVRVGSASGELLYEGLLTQGNSLSFKRKRLWIRMGAPQSLDATLNGTTVSSLPAGTADIIVTAAGVRTVSVG